MGVFGNIPFIGKKNRYEFEDETVMLPTVETYMDGAQAAAAIISKGIDRGSISDITEGMEKLNEAIGPRDKYVFESFKKKGMIRRIVIYVFLTLLLLSLISTFADLLHYSQELRSYGIKSLLIAATVIVANILFIRKDLQDNRFLSRYDRYYKELKFKRIVLIDDLASAVSINPGIVLKDLKRAVKDKLIPHGHFGRNNTIFLVSDEENKEYLSKQAEYDRYYDKQLEERARAKERTPEIDNLLQSGQEYVRRIHEINDIIKDMAISEKLYRMEDVVSAIIHEVEIDPSQVHNLGMFMDYYLPTTIKLLETYIDMDEKKVKGKNIKKVQSEIVEALDAINVAFENLLDRFYLDKEMDISSDISVMDAVMRQNGIKTQ